MKVPCCAHEPAVALRCDETLYVPPSAYEREQDAIRAVVAAACRTRWASVRVLGVSLHPELDLSLKA